MNLDYALSAGAVETESFVNWGCKSAAAGGAETKFVGADYLAVVLPNRPLGSGKGGVTEERKAVVNLGF